jgi:hypothetical protein
LFDQGDKLSGFAIGGLAGGEKKKTFVGSFLSVQQQHQQINRVMSWVLDIRLIWW